MKLNAMKRLMAARPPVFDPLAPREEKGPQGPYPKPEGFDQLSTEQKRSVRQILKLVEVDCLIPMGDGGVRVRLAIGLAQAMHTGKFAIIMTKMGAKIKIGKDGFCEVLLGN